MIYWGKKSKKFEKVFRIHGAVISLEHLKKNTKSNT